MELTGPKTESPRRKRRWFQYSLRTLLAVMLLVSIGTSWLAVKRQQARRQREAVEAIEKLGGDVTYNYTRGPAWLRNLLGVGFFPPPVVLVDLSSSSVSDTDLKHLARLTQLRFLCLNRTQVTDAGLDHLAGLTQLRLLELTGTKVTEDGMKNLGQILPHCFVWKGQLRLTGIADSILSDKTGTEESGVEVLAYSGPSLVGRFSPQESKGISDQIQRLVQTEPSIGLPPITMAPDVTLKIKTADEQISYDIYGGGAVSVVDGSPDSERRLWFAYGLARSIVNAVHPGTFPANE